MRPVLEECRAHRTECDQILPENEGDVMLQCHQEAESRKGHLFPSAKVFKEITALLAVSLLGSLDGQNTVTIQNVCGIQNEVCPKRGKIVGSSIGGK